ncbi:MAG: SUMF1/EgtB/PvdO family nonheme iron enzyme [Lewinellaceae bacterium]|nr:SUMF1/EgtB/PvdO family nonheme iron enzyme [Lewinellaceae bacterium]
MVLKTGRVLRGGSWNNNNNNCQVSVRNRNNPNNRNNNIGFRLAQYLPKGIFRCPVPEYLR